jgi:periplasmic protein TonB
MDLAISQNPVPNNKIMETGTDNDKRSRNIGLIASLCFHGGIALLLFLLVAWKAPNPPLPDYGVEINLGFSDAGTGEIQPETEVGDEGTKTESAAQPEETVPQEAVKEETEEEQQQEEIVTDDTNPVSVKEEKKEVKEEVKKEAAKEVVKETPKKEEPKVVKEEAVFTPKETTDKTTGKKKGENISQGNDKNAKGDKGQPDGTLNPDAAYSGIKGGGAGGSGTGLDLAGWKWDRKPDPKIPENESGRLIFEIEVDENGEITKLVAIERGLSAQAEKICRDEILKLTFSQTGVNVPTVSKGRITFVVKAQ